MGDSYPRLKAAAVQAAPVFLDREATVEKACRLIGQAASHGAQLIVFPECFIPGFPHWFAFLPAYECRGFIVELFKNAVEVPSPAVGKLAEAAREASAYVVMGINERRPGTMGTLYNSQLFLGADGIVLGVHRKLVPTFTERLVHTGGDGSGLHVYPTPFGELGGLICGEHGNSLARFALLALGEKIHAASWPAYPTAANQINREGMQIRIRAHAFEGKVFVIAACGVFDDRMAEVLCQREEDRRRIVSPGGNSAIVGPTGSYLARPSTEKEEIVLADLNLEEIVSAKIDHDICGHYNRFDIFTLQINRRPQRPLRLTGADEGEGLPLDAPERT